MSHEHSRRSSTLAFSASNSVPDAPPLPAPRPLQRARDAAGRLFGYQSRPVSPQHSPEDERFPGGNRKRHASLNTAQNATASHRTGLEINTLAINEQGTHVLLGGKEIFKTVKIEDGKCTEEVNLRSAIRSNPLQASGKTRQIYSIDIADVAWAKGDCSNLVAAATSSGKIILYDLSYAGLQAAQLHEHFRQVHNVTFNPHRGSYLLSGSQDGTVRLWDIREARVASTIHSKRKYSGLSDGVRDVKWSPTEGVDFAFGTDSGWIQRWDMRNLKHAKVKIPAHGETCNTIDWHPDGKHIASASSDMTVRVWDFSSTRKHKASWEIKTPYPVFNARWRPTFESSIPFDNGAKLCTQLVTAYDQQHPVLHVWDFRRPALPFREVAPLHSAPTDLIWHSQDLLWSVGREGTFVQSDIQHATKILDKQNLQAFAVSPRGDVNFVTQKRRPHLLHKRRSLPALTPTSSNISRSPERNFLSRSWADDSLDHTFLSPLPSKSVVRSASHTRAPSISSALESYDFRPVPTMTLDDLLLNRKSFKPRQTGCRGLLPGSRDPEVFRFLAQMYKIDAKAASKSNDFLKLFEDLLQHNERCAEYVGLYRLSQTWKILSFAMTSHLRERALMKCKLHEEPKLGHRFSSEKSTFKAIAREIVTESNTSRLKKDGLTKPVSALTQQLVQADAVSDQQTPLARPLINGNASTSQTNGNLPDIESEDHPALPQLVSQTPPHGDHLEPHRYDGSDIRLTSSNLNDLQRLQPDTNGAEKSDMVQRWSTRPRVAFDAENSARNGVRMPKLEKHDSNESFTFLEGSFDSREHFFPSSHASNSSGKLNLVAERPSRTREEPRKYDEGLTSTAIDFSGRNVDRKAIPIIHSENLSGRPDPLRILGETASKCTDGLTVESAIDGMNEYDYGLGSYPDENGISNFIESVPTKRQDLHEQKDLHTDVSPHSASPEAVMENDEYVNRITDRFSANIDMHDSATTLYLPADNDDDIESDKPFYIAGMVRELATFYANQGDAQTAAHILLVLKSLLPRMNPLQEDEMAATISVYTEYFSSAGLGRMEIEAILNEYFKAETHSGLQPLHIESVLSTYHDRLVTQGLFNEAATIRKLAYPAYPAVYDQAVKDNYVSLSCGDCGKPISSNMSTLRCENCGSKQAKCTICWCNDCPFERTGGVHEAASKLLSTCLLCNHSGHSVCLRIWYDESGEGDGACPIEGCLCDCIAGTWRSSKMQIAEPKRRSRTHERVQSDEWSAKESKAVERTRAVLGAKSRRGHRPKSRG